MYIILLRDQFFKKLGFGLRDEIIIQFPRKPSTLVVSG